MPIIKESSWIDDYKTKYTTPFEDLMDAVDSRDKDLMWDYLYKTDLTLEDYMNDFFSEEEIEDVKDCVLGYAYNTLQYGLQEPVELHRVIFLKEDGEPDESELGLCWAADPEGAEYFLEFCDQPKVVYFKAHTSRDNINWAVSIGQNIRCLNEHELRVIEEDKVVLDKKIVSDIKTIEDKIREANK